MDLLGKQHLGGTTICLVTHDDRFLHLADRRMNMLDGVMAGEWFSVFSLQSAARAHKTED